MLPVLASLHTLALPPACMCAELQLTTGLPPDTSLGQRPTDRCIKITELSCQADDRICMHASSSLSLEILAGQRCIHKRVACAGPLRSKTCLSQTWGQTTTAVQGLLAQKTCECVTLQPVIRLSKQTHAAHKACNPVLWYKLALNGPQIVIIAHSPSKVTKMLAWRCGPLTRLPCFQTSLVSLLNKLIFATCEPLIQTI